MENKNKSSLSGSRVKAGVKSTTKTGAKTKANDSQKKANDSNSASQEEVIRFILGGGFLFFGFYVTISILSYFWCWKSDQSLVEGLGLENPQTEYSNFCGQFGAWVSEQLVGNSFGVIGIVIPIALIVLATRMLSRKPLKFLRSFNLVALILILTSTTLAAIFNSINTFGSGLGGEYGIILANMVSSVGGAVGLVTVLVAGWFLLGVFVNRNFIHFVGSVSQKAISKSGNFVQKVKITKPKSEGEEIEEDEEEDFEQNQEDTSSDQKHAQNISQDQADEQAQKLSSSNDESKAAPQQIPYNVEILNQTIRQSEAEQRAQINNSHDDLVLASENREAEGENNGSIEDAEQANIEAITNEVREENKSENPFLDKQPTPQTLGVGEMEILRPEEEPLSEGIVVTVEANELEVVSEDDAQSAMYDPMLDLNNYEYPHASLLEDYKTASEVPTEEIYENKAKIEETLKYFGIAIIDIKATVGPTITLYEIVQEQGVKISKIQGLENDIAQSLKATGIRIIAPIPGRGTIGIEVPNRTMQIVSMYSSIRSKKFQEMKAELPIVVGRTIQNESYVFDLAKMPHLLVAGATGQGKSVGLNAIITSLLYRKHPAELKFVMIDPKMVEFTPYKSLERHFMAKMESEDDVIITDPKKAVYTLNALCEEMEKRLKLLSAAAVRNIIEYNNKFKQRRLNPDKGHFYMPYIVVVIDEFADLIMMTREVEVPVMRLAQKARAVGIHLIVATQRPDVKVITGGIKANFPARIAFRVMQMIDSRTIIDQPGANQLIGRGDMLFSKDGVLTRIQCALVETDEVCRIVEHVAGQQGYSNAYSLPDYTPDSGSDFGDGGESDTPVKYDALFAEIARTAVSTGGLSTSYIQRNFEVGFNRAGRIMTQLERAGIVGRQEGAKPREILFHDLPSLEAKLQSLGLF